MLRKEQPDWWNAPVPAFGDPNAWLAIVGLAPGREGANRTGRPFTGDASGQTLFATLKKFGFLQGQFENRADDGARLNNAIILNAVKCLPPDNKPIGSEIANCRKYLKKPLSALPQLTVILALGKIAHDSLIRMHNLKPTDYRFAHGNMHRLTDSYVLIDSYHCSRYNMNTRRLTEKMFEDVFIQATRIANTSA